MRATVDDRLKNGRITEGEYASPPSDGLMGAFQVLVGRPFKDHQRAIRIISSGPDPVTVEGQRWEHVSAHAANVNLRTGQAIQSTPSWEEMCLVKSLFWNENECVIQFHPEEKHYVNHNPYVLHLWRWIDGTFPTPPIACV